MKRLILFDIDGTLIQGGPLWRECFEAAFATCLPGIRLDRKVGFNGKTDPQICHEMIEVAGAQRDAECVNRIIDDYLRRAEAAVVQRTSEVRALPGAHQILQRLAGAPGVTLGLLTGNVRRGARLKLSSVGMDHYFGFGVFGDDHWDRYQLPGIAVSKAESELGLAFRGKEIVVIGDTIHDVNCGKSIGVRSIAVGTGRGVDRTELLAACPDYFFEDLNDEESVFQAIIAE